MSRWQSRSGDPPLAATAALTPRKALICRLQLSQRFICLLRADVLRQAPHKETWLSTTQTARTRSFLRRISDALARSFGRTHPTRSERFRANWSTRGYSRDGRRGRWPEECFGSFGLLYCGWGASDTQSVNNTPDAFSDHRNTKFVQVRGVSQAADANFLRR